MIKGKVIRMIGLSFVVCHLSFSLCACSEENTTEDEFANWQERNEAQTAQWATNASNGMYRKIVTYTKDESAPGLKNSDYIYVEVLEEGEGKESPIFTDIVRMAYRGHLIPTTSYSEGYVFDQSYLGNFDWQSAGMTDMTVDATVVGISTALMNMHEGDRWIVHVPYQLGYGTTAVTGIPAYSDLTFEVALKMFFHQGEDMGIPKSR